MLIQIQVLGRSCDCGRTFITRHSSCLGTHNSSLGSLLQELFSKTMDFLEEELEIVRVDEWCDPCVCWSARGKRHLSTLKTYHVQD